MNAKQLIAVSLAAFAATGAIAQEATSDSWMNVSSTQSREAVKASVAQARANGTLQVGGEATIVKHAPTASTKTREQVRAEGRAKTVSGAQLNVYNIGA